MIETFMSYINMISGGNQTLAAAIMLSLSGFGGILMRNAPENIKNFVLRFFVAELTFNNVGWYEENTYKKLTMHILGQCRTNKMSKFSIHSFWSDKHKRIVMETNLGYGSHFLWYTGKLIMVVRSLKEQTGQVPTDTTTIYTWRINKHIFETMIAACEFDPTANKLPVFTFIEKEWRLLTKEPMKNFNALALNQDTIDFFDKEMMFFLSNQEAYHSLNLAYKETIILHGKPGSGKTSLIKALACKYEFSVYLLNLSTLTDESLRTAFASVPEKSFLVIEDFDSATVTKQRVDGKKTLTETMEESLGITLSGFLNTLDGICALDKIIVFMTTNHLNNTDEAIRRPGRVDHVIELPAIGKTVVKKHFEKLYPQLTELNMNYADLDGCEINRIIFQSKLDHHMAAKLINEVAPIAIPLKKSQHA